MRCDYFSKREFYALFSSYATVYFCDCWREKLEHSPSDLLLCN